ncbi:MULTISPECIES: hypothetical protein [Agathobacter]|uniref:Uncharacterized protein n=1 Tax=Agathobacter ruminis TaxID=1712665 RepID=A0A2G3E6I9_9FIRM|nr:MULTISPECIES: hypothetical protein [Agathobacter]MBQ1680672.1 hypothetical protein [Agathobacter sp.]MDC7301617.1 hypothetical protein [Agathobacter ruminis]PHU38693.1 hypothetical protein CSX02_01730 [Agathobacter ruminis]
MGAQDKIEKVLRDIHVLLSKSEPLPGHPGQVVITKQEVLDLLSELNTSIYGIMDEYEMTVRSRDKAEREFRKRGDEIIWDASRKAEDVYAASVMYSEEAIDHIQEIMEQATESMESIYKEMNARLLEEQKTVQSNKSELKAQLRDLRDTEKYLRLIEDRNEEILKEKRRNGKEAKQEASLYANRKTEIKVNTEVLEKLGLAETQEEAGEEEQPVTEPKTEEISKPSDDDLELLDEKATFSNLEEALASKKKEKDNEGFGKMFKNLTNSFGGNKDKKV